VRPYWDAWSACSHGRKSLGGFGVEIRAIPLTEIVAYCDLMQIRAPEERTALRSAVQMIDAEFMKLVGKKDED
jgi:hypothetical protein